MRLPKILGNSDTLDRSRFEVPAGYTLVQSEMERGMDSGGRR